MSNEKTNENNREYNSTIIYSSKELTPREVIKYTDSGDALVLDKQFKESETLKIDLDHFVVVKVENPRSKQNKEYTQCIIVDSNGTRYRTGSESFTESLKSIYTTLREAGDNDPISINVYKVPSKNFDGSFIKCSLI